MNELEKKTSYLEICRKAVEEVTGRKHPGMTPTDKLVGDLGLESIDVLEFIFVLERVVEKRIPIELLMSTSGAPNGRFSEVQMDAVILVLLKLEST